MSKTSVQYPSLEHPPLEYQLYLFDGKNTLINKDNPTLVSGVTLHDIAPMVIAQIEKFPLGTLSAVCIFTKNNDDTQEFITRYSIKDYLNNNIPRTLVHSQ